MKYFSKFIRESVEYYRLVNVEVTYNVQPNEIILQAPETYQETDIQQYINDMWLNELPSSQDYAEKFFGKNNDNIIDVYFEYDSFEHLNIEPKEFITWKAKYDIKKSNTDIKLEYFKITNVKYHINFDRFDMIDTTDENVRENLIKIFKSAESNNENKYPIEIQFDDDNLTFRK